MCVFIEGVSKLDLAGSLNRLLYKLIVHLFMHKETRAGAAALSLVKEEGQLTLLNCLINVSIVAHNVRAFAT
jgi:hypothetical protein